MQGISLSMYRSNRGRIYRPILHSSCPPDLCPHPQLSEVAAILNFYNTFKQFGLLTFASKSKTLIGQKMYILFLLSHGRSLMLNGIKSQFDVTSASPHFVSHTGISTLSNLPTYSTTLYMQCCHTRGSLSSFLSTLATLLLKSSEVYCGTTNSPGMDIPKVFSIVYQTKCVTFGN